MRVHVSKHPSEHTAHGQAQYQLEMVDAKSMDDQRMVGIHHIDISVIREACFKSLAGFAGVTKSNGIGNDEKILMAIKYLTEPKKFTT